MMRICSPQLGIAPNATLGGEVYDRETLTHLAELGVEVEVILPAGLPYPANVPWRVTRVPLRKGYRWFVSNLVFVPYIGRIYRQQPFDLLRVHSLRFTGLAALWARRIFRLPVPIVAHHHHVDRDRWSKIIDGGVVQQVDRVITVSDFARRQLIAEIGAPPTRVEVAYNGISEIYRPDPARSSGRAQFTSDGANRPKTILHVGSLIRRKNLSILLQAFQQVVCEGMEARLVLIGRGPEEAKLRDEAQRLGIARQVEFAGFVTEAEKVEWYARSDLFVSASKLEGFGLAVGEAMACGLPVVVTNSGALPELVIDGESGLIVPVDEREALGAAIKRVLADPQLASSLGMAGAKRIEQEFRWPKTAKRLLAIYQQALYQQELPQ
jgi:glycosyltransferase involved in cell wall biosynthesis